MINTYICVSFRYDPLMPLLDQGPHDVVTGDHIRLIAEHIMNIEAKLEERKKRDVEFKRLQIAILKACTIIAKSYSNFEKKANIPMTCQVLHRNLVRVLCLPLINEVHVSTPKYQRNVI